MQWWKDFFVGIGFVLAVMIGIMIFMIIPIISILYGHPLWGGVSLSFPYWHSSAC
jgi:hypothetical protein